MLLCYRDGSEGNIFIERPHAENFPDIVTESREDLLCYVIEELAAFGQPEDARSQLDDR